MTDEQAAKFKELQKEARKELEEIITAKDARARARSWRSSARRPTRRSWTILTDEQKTKAKEMVGEPFKGEIVFEEPD